MSIPKRIVLFDAVRNGALDDRAFEAACELRSLEWDTAEGHDPRASVLYERVTADADAIEQERKKRAALTLAYHAQTLELRETRAVNEALFTACKLALELLESSPTASVGQDPWRAWRWLILED